MYTKSEVLRINKEYEQMYEFLQEKTEEICKKIGFVDDVWSIENIDIDKDYIGVRVYDTQYDMYDSKYMKIPIDWFFSDSWEDEWKKMKEKEEKEQELKKLKEKQAKEDQEFQEYQRLKTKFGNK